MAGGRKNVLWVDDEIEFLRSHIMFLETRGYSVVPVFSGDEAIQTLRDEPRRFDIVLLDEQMPGKDGLTTLEEIKEMLPQLPVVMVTKSEEEQLMEDALGRKIDGYLTKPVNPSQILSVCKALLDSPRLISSQVTQRFVRDYSVNRASLARDMTAADWVRLYENLSAWDLELASVENEGLRQNHAGQKSDCDAAFARFVSEHYPEWLKGRRHPPVLSTAVAAHHVAPLLAEGKKVRFVVFDCMRLDQYLAIEPLLRRYYEPQREHFFSILPTTPQFSRTSLFGGKMPGEMFREYPQLAGEEECSGACSPELESELLEKNLASHNVSLDGPPEFAHITSAADANAFVERIPSLADRQLVTVAVDFFHMLTHGRSSSSILQEITADESSLRALTQSWFHYSPVFQILREFAHQGMTVVLTTDHGSMLCNRGIELYGAQGLTRHPRHQFGERITCDERRCLYLSSPGQFMLPTATDDTVCILAIENYYFCEPHLTEGKPESTQNTFFYGGISMEEMIVPLAIMTPTSV
jgi:CheY-like chemotaxis protein